jgi:hypothetical protein
LEREGRVKKKENVVKEREGEMSAAAEEVRGREVKVKDEEKLMQMWKQEVKTHADETKTESAALQKRAEMLDEKETNLKACAN